MWFIGGGGDEIPDGRWRASNGYVIVEKESGNISVCFVVNKAKQQVKWSVRLDEFFSFLWVLCF